jgi:YD repeat-containing protein
VRRRTGEVTAVRLPDGSHESYERDAAGLLVGHRNAYGHLREWLRNARGQVVEAVDAAQRSVHYRYDAHGRLRELRSAAETRYLFEYDAADLLATETRPDGIERHLRYDEAGHLVAIGTVGTSDDPYAPPPTRETRFERDAAGRLLARSDETATTTYARDLVDRLVQARRAPTAAGLALGVAPDTLRFDYDAAGRLVAEHGANGTVRYELDELDQLEALQLPHGQRLMFASYGSGHVHRIAAGGELVTDIERDDLHREVMRTQGRLMERTGYDPLGRKLCQSVGEDGRLGPAPGRRGAATSTTAPASWRASSTRAAAPSTTATTPRANCSASAWPTRSRPSSSPGTPPATCSTRSSARAVATSRATACACGRTSASNTTPGATSRPGARARARCRSSPSTPRTGC